MTYQYYLQYNKPIHCFDLGKFMIKLFLVICLCLFLNVTVNADNKYLCVIDPKACNGSAAVNNTQPVSNKAFTNFIGMSFMTVPAGHFYMGSRKVKGNTESLSAEQWM